MQNGGDDDEAVFEEMRRIQGEGSHRSTIVLTLVVVLTIVGLPLVIFAMLLRAKGWGVIVGPIAPLLLLNEVGHAVVLRWFGCRVTWASFMPFVGLTESRGWGHLPTWKRTVIALAGSAISIIALIAMAVAYKFYPRPWLLVAIIELTLLVGVSLVPIWPYDGGCVVDLLLACRHPWLRVAFRWLSVVGNLPILGVWLLIKMPEATRVERVAQKIRLQNTTPENDGQKIKREVVLEVIQELRQQTAASTSDTSLAKQSIDVCKRLAVCPPSLRASLCLGAVYVGCFVAMRVAPFAGLSFAVSVQQQHVQTARNQAREIHRGELRCDGVKHHVAENKPAEFCRYVIASFESPEKAKAWLTSQAGTPGGHVDRLEIGRSLVFAVPGEKGQLADAILAAVKPNALHAYKMALSGGSIVAEAPDQARAAAIATELNHYLDREGCRLIEPWSPSAQISEDAAKWRALRFRYVADVVRSVEQDPRVVEAHANLKSASSRKPKNATIHEPAYKEWDKEFNQLRKVIDDRKHDVRQERHDELVRNAQWPMEREFLELCWKRYIDRTPAFAKNELAKLTEDARKLDEFQGRIASIGEHPSLDEDRYEAQGRVTVEGTEIRIFLQRASRMDYSWPELVRYLCERGLKPIRYEFSPL